MTKLGNAMSLLDQHEGESILLVQIQPVVTHGVRDRSNGVSLYQEPHPL